MASRQNQCSEIGNELYQREVSQKIPSEKKNQRSSSVIQLGIKGGNNGDATAFRPHMDPYRNDRNLPQYFQNIAASIHYDSYEMKKPIKDRDY